MKHTFIGLILATLIAGIFVSPSSAQPPFQSQPNNWRGQEHIPGELIIKFKDHVPSAIRERILARLNMRKMGLQQRIGAIRYRLPRLAKLEEIIEECQKDENIEYVEPNYRVYAHFTPNDQYFRYQWNFDNPGTGGINVKEAWDITTGDPSVVVAIIDTGIAYEDYVDQVSAFRTEEYFLAPELAQTNFRPGYDFTNNDSHPNDDHGHGTHIAGIIAQSTNNGQGTAGIAFNTSLMPVKVLDDEGAGTSFDVADGITWATDNGADVINLSLGSSSPSFTIQRACEYAHNNGVTVVCSTGNDGTGAVSYPAFYDQCCIAVGATRYDETRTFYSNYGPEIDVVAPGGDSSVDQNFDGVGDGILQQTFINGDRGNFQYYLFNGTSMAAPHVSGVAALLLASGRAQTPAEVREALQATAKDLGTPGWDPEYGWGLIDAAAALRYSGGSNPGPQPPINNAPVADPGGPYSASTGEFIQFDGGASSDPDGDALTYRWGFGDGRSATGIRPSHQYTSDGVYTVRLTVNDGQMDSLQATTLATISSDNQEPVANPGGPYTADVGDLIRFTGSGSSDPDGSIRRYQWDFGDGSTSTFTNPSRRYNTAGVYTVTLTVTDNDDATNTQSTTATIIDDTPPPPPPPSGGESEFNDGFEEGEWNGNWTEDSQNDWRRSGFKRNSGRYAAEVDGQTQDGALISRTINLQGSSRAEIAFAWYIDRWLDAGEYMAFDISTDNGTTWVEQRRIRPETDPVETWINVQMTVNHGGTLKLRFRGSMNFGGEDAYVDDVRVTAR